MVVSQTRVLLIMYVKTEHACRIHLHQVQVHLHRQARVQVRVCHQEQAQVRRQVLRPGSAQPHILHVRDITHTNVIAEMQLPANLILQAVVTSLTVVIMMCALLNVIRIRKIVSLKTETSVTAKKRLYVLGTLRRRAGTSKTVIIPNAWFHHHPQAPLMDAYLVMRSVGHII